MEVLKIGKIVNVVGLKGEVKVYNYSDNQRRYESLNRLYIGKDMKEFSVKNVRYKDKLVILKLSNISDRNMAEKLKNEYVYMAAEDLEELPEGIYYIRDMIGMDVISDAGVYLGKLSDILTNTAQKVYVIKREGENDILIPGVDEFILDINMKEKVITVKVIEGLYEN